MSALQFGEPERTFDKAQVHVGKLAVVIAALDADAVIEQRRTRRRRQLVEAGVVVAENDPVRLELPVVAQAHFPVRAPGRRQLLARDDATHQFAIDRVIVQHKAAVDPPREKFAGARTRYTTVGEAADVNTDDTAAPR